VFDGIFPKQIHFKSIEINTVKKLINSFLNPNDDFGTLKKGVVLDNQTYEYEVNENDSSNFTIIELGDESEVKSE
jgi:hypothetical protein